jgi:hypothetical protein
MSIHGLSPSLFGCFAVGAFDRKTMVTSPDTKDKEWLDATETLRHPSAR